MGHYLSKQGTAKQRAKHEGVDVWTKHLFEDLLPELGDPYCPPSDREFEKVSKKPISKGWMTIHKLGLIIAACFCAIAIVLSLFLIWRHATHYLKPYEQKHIIRILIMIPIYALVSLLSVYFYAHALYFEVLRDCYEAFAIASFFTLMCHYIAPTLHEQKEYFRDIEPKNWVWPVRWAQKCTRGGQDKGIFRRPRSGLTWFNVIWISIFQYCFVRPTFTLIAVIAQYHNHYCQGSKSPRYAYIWVAGANAVSVTVAMYCLAQFYIQLAEDISAHRPFLKFASIKLILFFTFWQAWLISLVASQGGPLRETDLLYGADIHIGIPSVLVCIEMAIFAVLHVYAFPWAPYDLKRKEPPFFFTDTSEPDRYAHGPIRALLNALNPWDIVKAFGRGVRWLFIGIKNRKNDSSYRKKPEPTASPQVIEAPGSEQDEEEDEHVTELPMDFEKNEILSSRRNFTDPMTGTVVVSRELRRRKSMNTL